MDEGKFKKMVDDFFKIIRNIALTSLVFSAHLAINIIVEKNTTAELLLHQYLSISGYLLLAISTISAIFVINSIYHFSRDYFNHISIQIIVGLALMIPVTSLVSLISIANILWLKS